MGYLCYDAIKANMVTEREKALELAISQIEKRFGKGSVMKLGEADFT